MWVRSTKAWPIFLQRRVGRFSYGTTIQWKLFGVKSIGDDTRLID